MPDRYPPITKCPHMLHGGDYNPDQWIRTPEIWDEDMRLMKLAGCNAMSIGIFAWSALEPTEGNFQFGWLDRIMDMLAENGGYAVLATPSGSKPAWLSRAYPEVCRVNADGTRQGHGGRHNHCRTSPTYREKCVTINTKLAERYKDHPALLLWHASNEYNGGECHCEHCYSAFHQWLRQRYDNDIDKLNHAYWSAFWSHTFPDWDYVIPTDRGIHGLYLDWRRFLSAQTIDFFKAETAPLREITPDVPVTTNFMTASDTLDYWDFAKAVDVITWDSYPNWHETDDVNEAARTALVHDINRSMGGGKPWALMESVPSIPTRGRVKKRKMPGMHMLSSLQAIAHGSDTVQYFQWRKSRGCMEKFHGAVVDHLGTEDTRVFRDVAELGAVLAKLDDVVGTTTKPDVAIVRDWENEWALNSGARVYLGENVKYRQECLAHYRPFWDAGISVDVIDQTGDLGKYKLVVAPMIYMLRPGFAERLGAFVAAGGTAVMTYWSAVVDESDLCYLGGVPGDGLREVFGDDFFAGSPAVTVNAHGEGKAYYLASRNEPAFLADFYRAVAAGLDIRPVLKAELPEGVTAQLRTDGKRQFVFLLNFAPNPQRIDLAGERFSDVLAGGDVEGAVDLAAFGSAVLEKR